MMLAMNPVDAMRHPAAGAAPLSPRGVHASGAVLVLSSISWVNTTVQQYSQGSTSLATQIALRVVPLLALLGWMFRADLRSGFPAARRIPTSIAGALLWYALVGMLAGIGSRLPSLAAWKGVELVIVAYWMSLASLTALAVRDPYLPLRAVVRPLALLMAWTLLLGLASPGRGFRIHSGPIPMWLQGWFPPFNPNTVGSESAVVLYTLASWRSTALRTRRWRLVWLLVLFAWLAAISRTAYLGLASAAAVALMARTIRLRTSRDIAYIALSLVLTGTLLIFFHQIAEFLLRGQSSDEVQTLSGRTAYWKVAFELWEKRPLFGGGLATGSRFLFVDYPELFRHGAVNIHNTYLEMLLGAGVIGAAPLLFGILRALFSGVLSAFRHGALPLYAGVAIIEALRGVTSIAGALFSFDLLLIASVLVAYERRSLLHPTSTQEEATVRATRSKLATWASGTKRPRARATFSRLNRS